MISKILSRLRCTRCREALLIPAAGGLACSSCKSFYPIANGILDMVGDERDQVITPFQRLMQAPIIVSIYEKIWRRIGYYIASSRLFGEELRTILRLRDDHNSEFVLDLACGTGVFTRPLARHGDELVVGLDLSRPMLRHARRLAEAEDIKNVLFIRGTAFSLPFADATFQYVNCCGALHLFDRPAAALKEIRRVLGRAGRLCVQTTIRPQRSAGIAYFLERFIRFGFFKEDELLGQIELEGFKVIEQERHRISFTFLAELAE